VSFGIDRLWEALRGSLEAQGVLLALVLIVVLLLVLPPTERKPLRQPVLLTALHLFMRGLHHLVPLRAQPVLEGAALAFLLAAVGRLLLLVTLEGPRRRNRLPRIIVDILSAIVYAGALIAALRAAGVEPGSLLTTSALLTAVIGLSLQETLGNLFAGLAIQLQRPFDVDDWIQFDADTKHIGRVVEINWRATRLVTLDDVELTVPNGTLAKAAIANFTKPTTLSRRNLTFYAPYDVPPKRVHELVREALKGLPGVVELPPPSVVTNGFGESGVEYWVRFFTDRFEIRDLVDGSARDRIWYALKRESLPLPYPNRTVHLEQTSDESRRRAAEAAVGERERILQVVDFLRVLSDEDRRKLASLTTVHLYAAGETIVHQGDDTAELFIVERGEVTVLLERGRQPPKEVARLTAGQFFGEMALVTGERRNATVRAASECALLVVGHSAFEQIVRSSPGLVEHISRVLAERQAALALHSVKDPSLDGSAADGGSQLLERIRRFFSL
jgi:small-conductance mechanosensitive channel